MEQEQLTLKIEDDNDDYWIYFFKFTLYLFNLELSVCQKKRRRGYHIGDSFKSRYYSYNIMDCRCHRLFPTRNRSLGHPCSMVAADGHLVINEEFRGRYGLGSPFIFSYAFQHPLNHIPNSKFIVRRHLDELVLCCFLTIFWFKK